MCSVLCPETIWERPKAWHGGLTETHGSPRQTNVMVTLYILEIFVQHFQHLFAEDRKIDFLILRSVHL